MSRMIEALKQIEARCPAAEQGPQSSPPAESDKQVPPTTDEAPQVDRRTGSGEAVRDEAAIEQTLARAEAAVAPVAAEPIERPARDHAGPYAELAEKIISQLPSGRAASLMFTSPGDGEGKTGMLVWLGRALAERNCGEVLLLDANLRSPDLAGNLGVRAVRGLADVLLGVASWPQVVCDTAVPRLSVLPGTTFCSPDGRLPERLNPERLNPEQLNLEPLLEELSSRYRLVLLDTASLAYGEVAPLARRCDGVYLVVRLGRTTRRAAGEAVGVLKDCGGRLLGCVVVAEAADG